MAEAVAVVRAKKQTEANGERDVAVLSRSESLLDDKFDAYETANYRMWVRSKTEAFSRRASTRDESCADGAEDGEGKETAAGALLKRSLTADATGKTMARGGAPSNGLAESMMAAGGESMMAGAGLPRSASEVTLQDAEVDEMDREVLQGAPRFTAVLELLGWAGLGCEAFVRVVALQQRVQHYRDLGLFVVLMALFITILYLQADSSRSYEITAAHSVLFPPVCPPVSPLHALPPRMLPPYPTPFSSPSYAPRYPSRAHPRLLPPNPPHSPTHSFSLYPPVCSPLGVPQPSLVLSNAFIQPHCHYSAHSLGRALGNRSMGAVQ
ncbi:unnamed protein product [Closterium sp. Yama58-4]|nr:unnamed protein product [Closterium sp. Yama58-4]